MREAIPNLLSAGISLPALPGAATGMVARTNAPVGDLTAQLANLAEVARFMASADMVVLAEVRWELRGKPQVGENAVAALPHSYPLAAMEGFDHDVLVRWLSELDSRPVRSGLVLPEAELALLMHDGVKPGSRGLLVPVDAPMPSAVFVLVGTDPDQGWLPDAFLATVKNTVSLHRRAKAWQESADSSREAANRWQWLLSLAADAVWDADGTGRIHSVRPLGDRLSREAQQAMLRHNALHVDGHGSLLEVFAGVSTVTGVQAHIHTGSEKLACRVSAQRINGSIRGVVTVVEGPDAIRQRHNLLTIIQRLNRVRERERDLRLEAETLLQGLRILTGTAPSHRMLADLLELLRTPLGFEASCVVRRNLQGGLETMPGADEALAACDWSPLAGRLESGGDAPMLLDPNDDLSECLSTRWRSIVVTRLDVDLDAAWLVCVHSGDEAFRPQQLGLLSRLVLLAKQALASDEQRRLVVHSSKLATLGEMVTSLAHEINQPLGTIGLAVGNLMVLLDKPELDRAALVGKAERIGSQVERVQAITRRMRNFARKGDRDRRHARFPLHRHVGAAADLVEGRLRRHGIQVAYEGVDAVEVIGDAELFEHVVVNILANAADAIAARRSGLEGDALLEAPLITVGYGRGEYGMVEVTFRDCGTGFDSTALAHALDPFFTTKDPSVGTGLGLAVSNTIMLDMEGWLRPSNWEGGGQVTIALRSGD